LCDVDNKLIIEDGIFISGNRNKLMPLEKIENEITFMGPIYSYMKLQGIKQIQTTAKELHKYIFNSEEKYEVRKIRHHLKLQGIDRGDRVKKFKSAFDGEFTVGIPYVINLP